MANHRELSRLRELFWLELEHLPKPVDYEKAVNLALKTLPPKQSAEFIKWMDTHGKSCLDNLNGR